MYTLFVYTVFICSLASGHCLSGKLIGSVVRALNW